MLVVCGLKLYNCLYFCISICICINQDWLLGVQASCTSILYRTFVFDLSMFCFGYMLTCFCIIFFVFPSEVNFNLNLNMVPSPDMVPHSEWYLEGIWTVQFLTTQYTSSVRYKMQSSLPVKVPFLNTAPYPDMVPFPVHLANVTVNI